MGRKRNPVIELVKAWELFEEQHPEGSLEDFYFYMHEGRRKGESMPHVEAPAGSPEQLPMGTTNALGVLIGRLNKYLAFYTRKVIKELPVDNSEDFFYLAYLHFDGPLRKSELIARNISEFTSGTNVINRLLKRGFILEYEDPHDARSKRVKITQPGIDWINACLPGMMSVFELLLHPLPEGEKWTAYQVLAKVDHFHNGHYPAFKNLPLEKIRQQLEGEAG